MIQIKNLTVRNFMSVGNATQGIDFDRRDLTLVLGENLDLGGDGSRNGTGKTTIINALSYALYGNALSNIRKDNLVNKTNGKGMLVSLDFSVNSVEYRIERGRKPNVLKFYVNNEEKSATDEAQGDSRETQDAIERIMNMSHDMFKHVLALNTYTEPFLSLKALDQRTIIEQLLGITMLSEKADRVKELNRQTKDAVTQEEFRIRAVQEANTRIEEQIDGLRRRQTLWQKKHSEDLERVMTEYNDLSALDIEAELSAHKDLVIWNTLKQQKDTHTALVARSTAWQQKHDADVDAAGRAYLDKNQYDIETELDTWRQLNEYLQKSKELEDRDRELARLTKEIDKEDKLVKKLSTEIESLLDHKCYACGQEFHDDQHIRVLTDKEKMLKDAQAHATALTNQWNELRQVEIFVAAVKPKPLYKTEAEAIRHSGDVANLKKIWEDKQLEINPFAEQLTEHTEVALGPQPRTHYDTEREAIEHRSRVASLVDQIERKALETDPYTEQIADMQRQALQVVSYDTINELTRIQEHQEFLLKLLTSKDSFVRKKIIDQNLSYLNARLTHYLDRIGLPHTVKFQNDLSVSIEELGRELDFDNLSRGERNRLILSMSWAFRDVWESLYSPINLLFIDELIDNGLDTQGVENALGLLKKMTRERHKSIWLVSHRDELAGRVENILKVIKENGFTSYNTDVEIA
jgi:DNA repair exonuclease SbcCD ATPase subunit